MQDFRKSCVQSCIHQETFVAQIKPAQAALSNDYHTTVMGVSTRILLFNGCSWLKV